MTARKVSVHTPSYLSSVHLQNTALAKGFTWRNGSKELYLIPHKWLEIDFENKLLAYHNHAPALNPVMPAYRALQKFSLIQVAKPQTIDELVEENTSLDKQLVRLEAEADELDREIEEAVAKRDALMTRINRKKHFRSENTQTIKAAIPKDVAKFREYL